MNRLTQLRILALPEATPFGVIEVDSQTLLEDLQEQHEAAVRRDAVRRADSRHLRRFIQGQPQRLVNLEAIAQPPGQPAWEYGVSRQLKNGLPREWANPYTNRIDSRD